MASHTPRSLDPSECPAPSVGFHPLLVLTFHPSTSSPFFPRGVIRAQARNGTPPNDSDESDDDNLDSEDVIRPSEMENGFRNLILCASLCNMATIHKGEEDRWEANGDATEIALQGEPAILIQGSISC